ncbi:TPA: Arc family DNA-binding protein [Morganella morganii]
MSKKDVQLNIRITQELKDRIEQSAKMNNRSINAEAMTLIEESLARRDDVKQKVLGTPDMFDDIKDAYPIDRIELAERDLVAAYNIVSKAFLDQYEDKIKEVSVQSLLHVINKMDNSDKK